MGESNADKLRRLFDRFWNHGDWEAGTAVLAPNVESRLDEVEAAAKALRESEI